MGELERLQAEVARLREAIGSVLVALKEETAYDEDEQAYPETMLAYITQELFIVVSETTDDWLSRHDAERDAKICELGNEVIRLTKLVARQRMAVTAIREQGGVT